MKSSPIWDSWDAPPDPPQCPTRVPYAKPPKPPPSPPIWVLRLALPANYNPPNLSKWPSYLPIPPPPLPQALIPPPPRTACLAHLRVSATPCAIAGFKNGPKSLVPTCSNGTRPTNTCTNQSKGPTTNQRAPSSANTSGTAKVSATADQPNPVSCDSYAVFLQLVSVLAFVHVLRLCMSCVHDLRWGGVLKDVVCIKT
jgi:hypothetical protein